MGRVPFIWTIEVAVNDIEGVRPQTLGRHLMPKRLTIEFPGFINLMQSNDVINVRVGKVFQRFLEYAPSTRTCIAYMGDLMEQLTLTYCHICKITVRNVECNSLVCQFILVD